MEGRSFIGTSLTASGSCLRSTEGSYGRIGTERVEELLKLDHLEQILYWFQMHKPPPPKPSTPNEFVIPLPPDKKLRRKSGLMTVEELKDTLAMVLDSRSYDAQLDNLFAKLDTSGDGYVDWNEFSTYLLVHLRESDYLRSTKLMPFQSETRIRHITNCRQDTTTRILSLTNPTKFVTISKEGIMNVWSQSLACLSTYNLNDTDMTPRPGASGGSSSKNEVAGSVRAGLVEDRGGRKVREWITDAAYMRDHQRIAVSSTGRDIRFYDTTMSSLFYEEYNLFGLPDVPTCLYYYPSASKGAESKALLLFGDDQGHVHILTFIRPSSRLFSKPYRKEEGVQRVYFPQLHNDAGWTSYQRLEYSHTEPIRKIIYLPDSNYVAASTGSSKASIVIIDIQGKKKSYSFNISKGVECFDYSRQLNVLVTGSSDHAVRLWNPYVTSRPMAVLQGHALGIVDVMIYEPLGQVFSLSRDAVLRVWDIRDQSCVQTVLIKFQIGYLQRVPDYGSFPTHLYNGATKTLLVAANDQLALLKLGQIKQVNQSQSQTHSAPLCGAIYNPRFKQVITASEDSSIGLWDMETGAKNLIFNNAHSGEEITTLALDATGKRLITGAINGSVKIWNVQNGHCLHVLEGVDESEVTGVIHVADRKLFLTTGWNRKIIQYPDTDPDAAILKADARWRAGQLHQEDILTVTYCPPNLLATGTFSGEIYVWFVETEALYKKLTHPLPRNNTRSNHPHYGHAEISSTSSSAAAVPFNDETNETNSEHVTRANSRRSRPKSMRLSTKGENSERCSNGTPSVDKLLFLNARIKTRRSDSAILISSEAGYLRWWNVFGSKQLYGCYYGASKEEESVLTTATNNENSLLVAGDTAGRIKIWQIEDFCREPSDNIITEAPDLLADWTAHSGGVVSVEMVDIDSTLYVLSASTDHTAKLWTTDGQPIGTFGQKKSWSLHQTPAGEPKPVQWGDMQTEKETDNQQNFHGNRLADLEAYKQGNGEKNRQIGSDKDITEQEIEQAKVLMNSGLEEVRDEMENGGTFLPDIEENQRVVLERSEDGSTQDSLILGSLYRERVERLRRDRRERRALGSGFNLDLALRPSTLQCCPYQAISLPVIRNIHLPDDIPELVTSSRSLSNESADLTSRNPADSHAYSSRERRQSVVVGSRKFNDGMKRNEIKRKSSCVKMRLPSIASSRNESNL